MKRMKVSWLILSGFIGIVLGTLFANIMERIAPESLAVFAIDQYSISNWILEERDTLGWFLVRKRGGQMLGILLLGFFCNSVFLSFVFTGFGGFIWGLFLSLETMRLGIQGLFLAIACFFPQGLCYVLAIWLFLTGKEQLKQPNGITIQSVGIGILLPIGAVIIGVLSEIWISPGLIYWILQK